MCAVLYQNACRKSSEDEVEDEEAENEDEQRVEVSRRIFHSRVDSGHDGFPQLI